MAEQVDTTVVISNYNYGRYVGAAIDSCIKQSRHCKIIVVDDASTDNSWEVISSYRHHQFVKLVRLKENSGGNARGKNVGIALTDTKYVTCLDSDDMLLPDSIRSRQSMFEGVDFVHGWTVHLRGDATYAEAKNMKIFGKTKFRKNARYRKLEGEVKNDPTRWAWAIQGNTVLSRKELYSKFGLYDEEMGWKVAREMWYRWLSHGAKFCNLDTYVAVYRKHGKNATILAAQNRGPKNAKLVTEMLTRRKVERQNITAENTLLLTSYDPMVYIDEILE